MIYSTRFVAGDFLNTGQLLYTVPNGMVAIVRSISCVANGSGNCDLHLGAGPQAILFRFASTANGAFTYLTCRHVLNAGDQLFHAAATANGAWWMISGYLLNAL